MQTKYSNLFSSPLPPPPYDIAIMPSFSKAGAFLLLLVMASSIITTTVVVASSVGSFDRHVRKIKNTKKQGITNKEDACTMELFLGKSQYTNCAGKETEVEIACANTEDAATVTTTAAAATSWCSYSEHPVQYNDTAVVATALCGDHGFFDPRTHLTRDHATGLCRLRFFSLTNSCFDAPAGGSRFGVMVEVPPSTGTSTVSYNHEHHEDHHKDNSGMLLWFSDDDGVTYYNKEDHRITGPLHNKSSSRRKLGGASNCKKCPCPAPTGDFRGTSKWSTFGKYSSFQTCYKYYHYDDNLNGKLCWSNSWVNTCELFAQNHQCHPATDSGEWKSMSDGEYDSCGEPCQKLHGHH